MSNNERENPATDPRNGECVSVTPLQRLSQRQRAYLKLTLVVVLILALVYVGRSYFGELERLRDTNPLAVAALVGVFLLRRLLSNEIMWQALRVLGHHISRGELLMLSFWRTYTNLIVPRGGAGTASFYLKTKHNVRFADFTSLFLPMIVLQLIAIGTVGLGAQLYFAVHNAAAPLFVVVFAAVLIIGLVGLLLRFPVPNSWPGRIGQFARRLNDSWQRLGTNTGLFWRVLGLQVVAVVVGAVQLYLGYLAIGLRPDEMGVLAASLLADVVFFISLTPNALGFREAAIVYSAELTGVNRSSSMAVAILDRIVVTITVILIAQIGLWRTIRPGLHGNSSVAAREKD